MNLDAHSTALVVGVVTALFGASGLGGYFIARVNAGPALAAALNAATDLLLKRYAEELLAQGKIIAALRADIEKLSRVVLEQTETIAGQTETIEALEGHIDELGAAMKQAGVPLPQRRRRKETA